MPCVSIFFLHEENIKNNKFEEQTPKIRLQKQLNFGTRTYLNFNYIFYGLFDKIEKRQICLKGFAKNFITFGYKNNGAFNRIQKNSSFGYG